MVITLTETAKIFNDKGVGASGKIVASFEAVVAPDELAAAIKAAKSG